MLVFYALPTGVDPGICVRKSCPLSNLHSTPLPLRSRAPLNQGSRGVLRTNMVK